MTDEVELLKNACREAYQYAWDIEQGSHEAGTRVRAREIKRVTMAALQATNAEFQAKQRTGLAAVPTREKGDADAL